MTLSSRGCNRLRSELKQSYMASILREGTQLEPFDFEFEGAPMKAVIETGSPVTVASFEFLILGT